MEIENYTIIPNIHSFGILITNNHCMQHFEKSPLQHARSHVGCVRVCVCVCVWGGGGGEAATRLLFLFTQNLLLFISGL